MEATRPASRSLTVTAASALVLALGAGACLLVGQAVGFLDPATEAASVLLTIIGWMLLVWAIIVEGAMAIHLARAARRRSLLQIDGALLLGAAAAIVGVLLLVPPFGSGSGAA